MSSDMVGSNLNSPVLEIPHMELKRFSKSSIYKSYCPVCKEGTLTTCRNIKTYKLEAHDRCMLCGQRILYTDIEDLRKRDHFQ